MLGNRIQALAVLHYMIASTILLDCMLLLFHQIDNITIGKHLHPIALIVPCKLNSADSQFLTKTRESITMTCYDIIVLIVGIQTMWLLSLQLHLRTRNRMFQYECVYGSLSIVLI